MTLSIIATLLRDLGRPAARQLRTRWLLRMGFGMAAVSGCAGPPPALPPSAQAQLRERADHHGALVYTGHVVPEGARDAAFRYERRVRVEGGDTPSAWVSTHLSYPVRGEGRDSLPVVMQTAFHDHRYALRSYEEIQSQTGAVARIQLRADGSLRCARTRGDDHDSRVEAVSPTPVVVGPTLFGFIRTHLDRLRAGQAITVRFAVAEQCRTYRFTLRMIEGGTSSKVIEMTADGWLARLAIQSIRIAFDDDSGNVVRYRGRVPPRLPNGRTFDANIEYEYAVRKFR